MKTASLSLLVSNLCLHWKIFTSKAPWVCKKVDRVHRLWCRLASAGNWCIRKASSRTHLYPFTLTLVPYKEESVDECLACLASILADLLRVDRGNGLFVCEGMKGQRERQAEMVLEGLAVWPIISRRLDVWICQHYIMQELVSQHSYIKIWIFCSLPRRPSFRSLWVSWRLFSLSCIRILWTFRWSCTQSSLSSLFYPRSCFIRCTISLLSFSRLFALPFSC